MNDIERKIGFPAFSIGDKVKIALSASTLRRKASYTINRCDGEEGTVVGIFLDRWKPYQDTYKYKIEVRGTTVYLHASDLEKVEEETHHIYYACTSTSGSTYDHIKDALDATRYGLVSCKCFDYGSIWNKRSVDLSVSLKPDPNLKGFYYDEFCDEWLKNEVPFSPDKIKKVIFNDPATIVFWADGTKTVVKCDEHDVYDKEKGLAMCIVKHCLGNSGSYYNVFKKWCGESKNTYPSFMSKVFCKFLTGDDEYHKLGFVKDGDLNGKDTK